MKKLILLSVILIVGCAPTKPPTATFYIGMTEKEFLELNKNKPITKNFIEYFDKNTTNMSQYIDGNDFNSSDAYFYTFKNDTLSVVHGNNMRDIIKVLLGKQTDYDKYATPPE